MSTDLTTTNNLLFLLAAAPLGLGCIIVTDDEGGSTGADSGNVTSTGTDSTTSEPGTDTRGTAEGSSSDGSTGTEESSTGVADSTGADTTTGGPGDACADYGAVAVECALPYADYAEEGCNYNLDYQTTYSKACGVAYEDFVACLSMLTCKELEGAGCPDEMAALVKMGCPAVE